MHKIGLLVVLVFSLFAEEIKITAKEFNGDEKKGLSVFTGDVVVEKGKDRLKSNILKIYFNKKNEAIKYEAIGEVFFNLTNIKSKYNGSAQRAVYLPHENRYHFFDNVHLHDIASDRKISGNEVLLDIASGHATVLGKKREPVVMHFKIKEKQSDENASKPKK